MKILNVIIFYNNYQEIISYINQINNIGKHCVDIAIVVNSDKFGEIAKIQDDFSFANHIKIYDFNENVGYLNAFLKVIRVVNIEHYDYLILSNSDIEYIDELFFEKLFIAKYGQDVGCIAPSVFAVKSRSYSNPHYLKRIPKRKILFLQKIFSVPVLARFYMWLSSKKSNSSKQIEGSSCYVYSPHGCYMIFTCSFARCLKNYIYGAILYSEESAIGELLLNNNYKCYYDNTLKISHNESMVTGKVDYEKRFKMWRDSLTYILKEFYSKE